jgi:hypothetical protein
MAGVHHRRTTPPTSSTVASSRSSQRERQHYAMRRVTLSEANRLAAKRSSLQHRMPPKDTEDGKDTPACHLHHNTYRADL